MNVSITPSPWLSIIIPTYNGEQFLARALTSIAEQEERDFECIIVDDGSTDSTIQIATTFTDKIPIILQHIQPTGNWAANSNLALANATGEYACFLHQDDYWLTNRLKKIRELIRQYPEAEMLLSPAIFVNLQGNFVGFWHCPLPKRTGPVDRKLLKQRLLIQNFIAIPSPVFRRATALKHGGLDESLWYTADWDFWLKLADHETIYFPKPLAAFRIHSHSQTVQRSFDISGFKKQMETVLMKHLNYLAVQGPSLERIKRVALFSIQVNTALAARIHGAKNSFYALLASFAKLGPVGWCQYLRDSRITDRITARLRAGISSK